jgi:RHS repeat-associated protein
MRPVGAKLHVLTYDTENRLTGLSGGVTASYVYDGDGNRVKETSDGTTTVYIGNYFEWTGSTVTMKSYYYAGGTRVAERSGASLYYLLGDHLGSTALTLDSAGNRLATNTELRYYPYGVARYTAGTTPTSFNFTGQRKDSGSGLLFYNARWHDPAVGRFLQPDTIVPQPGDPQSLNRYSYVLNNPVRYIDSSGHCGPLTPVCLGLLLGGMALLLQGDSPDLNVTPEDVASQRLGGALVVGGADLAGGSALAGTVGVTQAGTAATAACADGDCTNEVQTATSAAQTTANSAQTIMNGSQIAANTGNQGLTVLGRYPTYLQVGERLKANVLNDPPEVWNNLTRSEQWARNKNFLDQGIAAGHRFRLATSFAEGIRLPTDKFYKMELDYLLSQGYKLVVEEGIEYLLKNQP